MAARQAWSGWRNGEFGVLLAALFVAVLALAGVGSLAQRTSDALAEQSRRLVGGDAAFTSDDRAIAAALGDAQRLGLHAYRSVELASMVGRRGGVPELGMLKALSSDPPLLGPYTVRAPDGVRRLPRPAPGTLWRAPAARRAWACSRAGWSRSAAARCGWPGSCWRNRTARSTAWTSARG
ncbi:hypothetical protein LJB71_03290 [Thermomonas sp. S9]|uniref:hypothetical protein n=1 Tax=Thermomonas sp. S9 TaxID=2885203 RepID=UPI00216B3AA2|nr:hypothetical protein [Thermomonas sp. S9]MCR6495356.1 hypothetical protein [Thermomonas sp. S9]